MNDQKRTRLAIAIGWKFDDGVWHGKGSTWDSLMFWPLTNANDDYAVLEWARENLSPRKFVKFSENIANLLIGLEKKKPFDALCISLTTEYQIGFYAKAALPLIVEDSDHG